MRFKPALSSCLHSVIRNSIGYVFVYIQILSFYVLINVCVCVCVMFIYTFLYDIGCQQYDRIYFVHKADCVFDMLMNVKIIF